MKRIIPLVLTILLIPGLLAVPARADEVAESGWINLLDFGPPENYESNKITFSPNGSEETFWFDYSEPFDTISAYSIDIILRTDAVNFIVANSSQYLTIVSLGDGLYRCYGYADVGYSDANLFYLRTNNGSFCEILSYRICIFPFHQYEKIVVGKVFDYSTSPSTQSTVNYQGNGGPSNQIQFQSSSYDQLTWLADLDIYQWQTMDYIQFSASSFCGSLDSISVTCNGVNVPFSYVPTTGYEKGGLTLAFIDLLIDVRNLDRTDSSSTIVVKIVGSQGSNKTGNFIIQRCFGIVSVDPPSPESFWFSKLINSVVSGFSSVGTWFSDQTSSLVTWLSQINTSLAIGFDGVSTWLSYVHNSIGTGFSNVSTWISNQTFSITSSISTWGQNIVNAINPPTDTDDMKNEVENIRDQMQDANDVMNELQRPDIDDVFHEVQLDIGTDSPFANIMSGLFANDFIVTIVTGSLAFTLFGILVG